MKVKKQNNSTPAAILFALYLLMVIGIYLLPGNMSAEIVRENGVVEIFSAAGYFFFCLLLVWCNLKGTVITRLAPGVLVFFLGLRELDFHVRFTTMGMFKSRFFISPDVPLPEKVLVTLFILGLLLYTGIYFQKTLPEFTQALRGARPWAVSVVCGVACALVSKLVLDGNSGMIASVLPMLENPKMLSAIMEECLELFIPVFFIRALFQYKADHV